MAEARRPNVPLITTDQQRYDHLGLKGAADAGIANARVGVVDTPNLDRLGREGVHFDRAYTSCPVCTPARVTLLTGQYPSVHGAYSIGVTVDPFPRPTPADRLAAAGYATAIFGKTHFVRRHDEPSHMAGFPDPHPAFWRTFTGPYLGFQEVRVSRGHTTNGVPDTRCHAWLEDQDVDYAAWFPDMNGGHDHDAVGAWSIPPRCHDTSWVSGNTIDWISRHSEAAPDQPWFCWTSLQDPHEPFMCPEPWYSAVCEEDIALYPSDIEGEFADKPAFYQEAYDAGFTVKGVEETWEVDAAASSWAAFDDGYGVRSACQRVRVGRRQPLTERAREALRATLGMVAFIDDRVGAIMDAMDAANPRVRVISWRTRWSSIRRTTARSTATMGYGKKDSLRMSCANRFLCLCGDRPTSRRLGRRELASSQALVNLVDIPPTVLSLAGIEPPVWMQGRNLVPLLYGDVASVQDWTVVKHQATQNIYQHTFIADRHKLVVYRDLDDGELYDLYQDPRQLANLWSLPECQALKRKLMHPFVQANVAREGPVNPRLAFA